MNQTDSDAFEIPTLRRSTFGTLFSRRLPTYTGRYRVGVREVEVPMPPKVFGTFKHRSMPGGQVGITLDTVTFTLFYPAEPTMSPISPVTWIPRLVQTVDGLLKMSKWSSNPIYKIMIYAFVALITWGTTLPCIRNAPLKPPPGSTKWRIVLFSHGAGCSRFMNTTVCGELASRGYVVVAIEHRDGTCPSVRVTNGHGKIRDMYWLDWADLEWADMEIQPIDDTTLRRIQLSVRLAEVEGILQALRRVAQGQGLLVAEPMPSHGWEGWHVIEATRPIIAGHSFGGSLALAAAADRRFDFSHVIAFDPAMQRLEPWDKTISTPLLVINSEEYADGAEFSKLLAILPCVDTHAIYVICAGCTAGATHPSFSDVFLILPDHVNKWIGLMADPWHIVHRTVDTASRFLRDEETAVPQTIKCVNGLFIKDGNIGIGTLVRCHVGDISR